MAAPAERAGSIVAEKYQLGRMLGRGGMGVVYEATHRWTGRRVALKLIHPVLADDPALATRFLQEARAAARLKHAHVVDVLDMGRADDGTVYQALALLEGETLGELLKREGRLGWKELLTLLLPVIDALSAAHTQGVIHRDVKPENIFLHRTEHGVSPVLLDFGMAKLLDASSTGTPSSAVFGTPYYMAPEQALGASQAGNAADVWSMGAILFAALSGEMPFGKLPVVAYLARVISDDPRSLAHVAPNVPAALALVVDRALQRDINKRFVSMAELAEALCRAAREVDPGFGVNAPTAPLPSVPARESSKKLLWVAISIAGVGALMWVPKEGMSPKATTEMQRPTPARVSPAPTAAAPAAPVAVEARDPAVPSETPPSIAPKTKAKRSGQRAKAASDPSPRMLPPGMTEEW